VSGFIRIFCGFCAFLWPFFFTGFGCGTGINVDWFYRLPIVSVIAFLPGIQSLKEDEMRKISVLIGICMLAALAITILAQQAPPTDLSPVMKDVAATTRSEEHTSELQSRSDLVCRLL